MTDNIINLNLPAPMNVMSERIGAALARVRNTQDEWMAASINLIEVLLEARELFKSNNAFGHWLLDEGHDVGHQDRAALIAMAGCMELTRVVLSETPRRSYQLIWREEIQPRLTNASKTVSIPGMATDPQGKQPQDGPESKSAEPENAESSTDNLPHVKPARFGRAKPLARWDADGLMTGHFRQTTSRKTLAVARRSKNGAAIWKLVQTSIAEGFFGEPTKTDIREVGLRLVFPWLSRSALVKSFDLSNQVYRDLVEDVMFPLLREQPQLRRDMVQFERAFDQRRRAIEEGHRRVAKLAEHQQKVANLPTDQESVIAYGTPLWPPEGDLTGLFTYEELSHACWFATFFMEIGRKDWRPHETAMAARQLVKWAEPMAKGFAEAVRAIFNAYESHPEGDKRFPSPPVNFRNE